MLRAETEQLRQRLKQLEQQVLDAEKEATRREQAARQLETQRVIELESNKYYYTLDSIDAAVSLVGGHVRVYELTLYEYTNLCAL